METTQKPRTALIIHGHFYQPPRENPHTGIIGKQPSAAPFLDWNERIHADCYGANAHSRYLSAYRRILSMTNTYEYLSFNFGPTLLSWLFKERRETYEQIIEADKRSVQRLGHGNAIAQAFNHSILPLCKSDDAKIQINWGLEDFSQRFGRASEGMWLPETAINQTVVDLLAEAGVKFVILSPWQCKAYQDSSGTTIDLAGKAGPYGKPFILEGKKGGKINAFFYNPELAEGISFGHLLQDADNLYSRLISIRDKDRQPLIHTATDGEIYGHHEPYGDMALAALVKKVQDRDDFQFTNYATYLQTHPPMEKAILHAGEEAKGTSWSCSHGVSRWYKDCGCHTGGDDSWNQKWRTPLRDAFDNLSTAIDTIYKNEVQSLLGKKTDHIGLLSAFGPVASELVSMEEFLKPFDLDEEGKAKLARLLLGQKYKHFAYTSCGWFFNDLAGIEPKQNIVYALKAQECYEGFTETNLLMKLLEDLDLAKANRKQDGSGETIGMEALQQLRGEVEAALYFILHKRISNLPEISDSYGIFTLESFDEFDPDNVQLVVKDTQSLSTYRISASDTNPDTSTLNYSIQVRRDGETEAMPYYVDNDDIPSRMRDKLFDQIDKGICCLDTDAIKKTSRDIRNYATLAKNTPYLPMGSLYQELIGSALSATKSLFMFSTLPMWDVYKDDFADMLDFFTKYGRQPEIELIKWIFTSEMSSLAEKIANYGLYDKNILFILDFLEMIRERNFQPDLKSIQDAVYPYLSMRKQAHPDTDVSLINTLGNALNFDIAIR